MGQDGHRWPNGRMCNGHPVRVEAIDELVWNSVKSLLLEPDVIISEYQRRLSSYKPDYEVLIAQKNNEINRHKRERNRLIDLFQSGLVKKEEIEIQLKGVRSKLDQLSNEIIYLIAQEKESKKVLTVINNLTDFSEYICENLNSGDFLERRNIVKLLVETVEVDTM